jgi:hypothetical protein
VHRELRQIRNLQAIGREVPVAIIALLAVVAFVLVASALGADSRDGNDWGRHTRP